MIYNGFYSHKKCVVPIEIHNDGSELSVEIGGNVFKGSEFTDLCYQGKIEELVFNTDLLTLTPTPTYSLNDCSFTIIVPQQLILPDETREVIDLEVCFEHSGFNERTKGLESEEVTLKLVIMDEVLIGKGDLIEIAFDQLKKQLPVGYSFVNCYGCLYGDYSIYGNSSFGTMMCFKNIKRQYKAIDNKSDYEDLCADEKDSIEWVQEIYCCDEFEIRGNNGAYR